MSPTYSLDELRGMGVTVRGTRVAVDRSVRFFGPERVALGDRVRVDCFGLVSAGPDGIEVGNNVHVAAGCYLFGGGGRITLADFSGLSSRVSVYTATDDYTSGVLTNPTVPDEFRGVKGGPVTLDRHALVGAGAVLLPGVTLGFGAAVGALTLVRKSVREGEVVYGNPAQKLPTRRDTDKLRRLEAEYLARLAAEAAP